jgi:tRNA(Ile)-lysidine synthase
MRDGRFLRPLIADTGADIRKWCADNAIPYVTDATNADTDYTRNFIRHRLIPPMEEIAEHPQKAVLRMTSLLRQDSDFLEQTVRQYVPDGASSIDRTLLKSLHPAIASRVLIRLYGNRNAGASPEEIHIREMMRLAASDVPETSYSLPGCLCFRTDRHTIRIEPEEKRTVPEPDSGGIVFTYPTDGNVFENERYIIEFSPDGHANIPQEEENIYKLFICRTFCFDKIKNVLHIRYRRPGDICRIGGMTRKVKKLFIDQKLTGEEKALLPLICDDSGDILWIPHFSPCDGSLAGNGECGLTITFYEKKTL